MSRSLEHKSNLTSEDKIVKEVEEQPETKTTKTKKEA